MRKVLFRPLLPLVLALSFVCSYGQRYQTDDIVNETTWTVEDAAVVYISNDITISEEGSLTITAGVEVSFEGNFSINVRGKVFLNGTETSPVFLKNGFIAFNLLEPAPNALDAQLEARHAHFATFGGGAIMRGWVTSSAPIIKVDNCYFYDNEYAIRSYRVDLSNSNIQGGDIGVSLHQSTVTNTYIERIRRVCLFASSESLVVNCTLVNCGTKGAEVGGVIRDTTVTNAEEGIVATLDGEGHNMFVEASNCVVRGAQKVGLAYIKQVSNTVVLDSPEAIGAIFDTGSIDGSIIAGSIIGIQTNTLFDETASVMISNSYICGNSEAQFSARNDAGTSSATSTSFGDTLANQDTLGVNFFHALPYDSTAIGSLEYDLQDNATSIDPALLERENIDPATLCVAATGPIESPTSAPIFGSQQTNIPTVVVNFTLPTGSPTQIASGNFTIPTGSPTQTASVNFTSTSSPTQAASVNFTSTGSPGNVTPPTFSPTQAASGLVTIPPNFTFPPPVTSAPTVSQAPSTPIIAVDESSIPTVMISMHPSISPSQSSTVEATMVPSPSPSLARETEAPTEVSLSPTLAMSNFPTHTNSQNPTQALTQVPSLITMSPTVSSSEEVSALMTLIPTGAATDSPSLITMTPTLITESPSMITMMPTQALSGAASFITFSPTDVDTVALDFTTEAPSVSSVPSMAPTTKAPTIPQPKVAPPPKCGSLATELGRGGAAAQAKDCSSGRKLKKRLRGL